MASISDFTDEENVLLASVPYKAGLFVSYAEDEDGEEDDEREMAALEACLKAIVSLHEDQPLTAEVMRNTLAMRDEWPRWAAQSFNAPDDAAKAIAVLGSKASEQEIKDYRAAVMEVASAVAQAFGEFGEFEDDDQDGGLFGKITGMLSKISQDDRNHPMNISAAEDSALESLRAALSA